MTDSLRRALLAALPFCVLPLSGQPTSRLAAQDVGAPLASAAPTRRLTLHQGFEAVEGELLVRFHDGVGPEERELLHTSLDARERRDLERGVFHVAFEGRSLDEALHAYRADTRVDYAEPNWLRYPAFDPNDPRFASHQWGPQQVNAPLAWGLQRGSDSIVVAVIDSGVDTDHTDLAGGFAWGHDFYSNDTDPDDQGGHGTHVIGIAAADTDNGTGVAGMGFDCSYAAYRCGDNFFPLSDTIASINDAVAMGAHVINMSYGSPSFSTAERDALKAAQEAGCVNVAAAGNDGSDQKQFPAGYGRVIAVANTTQTDAKNGSSNYGDWVSVAAPGTAIQSTYLNGGYANLWGTSMASPLVAGLAGLLYAELGGTRSKANSDQIRAALETSSVPLDFVEHGRVDAFAALLELSPPPAPLVAAITPEGVDAHFSPSITLHGNYLASASSIEVAGTIYGPGTFTVLGDDTITLQLAPATALGPVDVTVTTAGGSASSGFEFVATSPPALAAPDLGLPGAAYTVEWAGGANDVYLLVWSISPLTLPFLGHEVLSGFALGDLGTLDATGYGSLTIPSLGFSGFLTAYMQMLDVDEISAQLVGVSDIDTTIFL